MVSGVIDVFYRSVALNTSARPLSADLLSAQPIWRPKVFMLGLLKTLLKGKYHGITVNIGFFSARSLYPRHWVTLQLVNWALPEAANSWTKRVVANAHHLVDNRL